MIQIIINGTVADYDARRSISYKCVTGWLSTDNLFSSAVYNLTLPNTMLNRRLMGYPSNPAVASPSTIACTVLCGGAQIIEGTLRVSKITDDSIQAIITDRLADLYANLRDMTFDASTRELPLHASYPAESFPFIEGWFPTLGAIQDTDSIYYPMMLCKSYYNGVEGFIFPEGVANTGDSNYEEWHNMAFAEPVNGIVQPQCGTSGYINTTRDAGVSYSPASMYHRSPFVPSLLMRNVIAYACETAGWAFDASTYPAIFDRLAVTTGYEAGGVITIGFEQGFYPVVKSKDENNVPFTIKLSDWGRTVNLSDLLIGFCQLANTGIEADLSTRTIRIVDKEAQLSGTSLTDLTAFAVSEPEIDASEYDAFSFSYVLNGDTYNEEVAKITADPSLIVSDAIGLPDPTYRNINKYALVYGASGLFQCLKKPEQVFPSWEWKGLADLIGYRSADGSAPLAVECLLHPFYYDGEGSVPYADMPAYRADFADVPAQPLRISFIPPCGDAIPHHRPSDGDISLKPKDIAASRYALLSRLATLGKPFAQTFIFSPEQVRDIARNKYGVYSYAGKAFVIDELTAEFSADTDTAIVKLTGIYL